MRKLSKLFFLLLFCFSFLSASIAKELIDSRNYFKNKKFAVLLTDELSAQAKKGLSGANTVPIIIKNGEWKVRQVLGGVAGRLEGTGSFKRNQILEIKKIKLIRGNVKMQVQSLKPMSYGINKNKYAIHAAGITFVFKKGTTPINKKIEFNSFFEIFETLKKAKDFVSTKDQVQIKEGMTIEEVEKILGKPNKIAKIGNKLLYKYDDWKITFVDGKVTEIDF